MALRDTSCNTLDMERTTLPEEMSGERIVMAATASSLVQMIRCVVVLRSSSSLEQ